MRRRALLAVPFVLMAVIATTGSADAGLPSSATHVAVSLGSQHSGIDGHLVAAASIAGTLKSSTGARLSGTVTAYRSGRPVAFGSVNNGDYVINGLAAGSYAVCMNGANVFTPNTSTGFLGRCYKSAAFNGVTVPSTAALITVHTNPATHRTGVNFVLPAAAAIAGKITSPTGAGLSSAFV